MEITQANSFKRTVNGIFMLLCILLLSTCGSGGKGKDNGETIELWDYFIPSKTGTITYNYYHIQEKTAELDDGGYWKEWEKITANSAITKSESIKIEGDLIVSIPFIYEDDNYDIPIEARILDDDSSSARPLKVKSEKIYVDWEYETQYEIAKYRYAVFGPFDNKTLSIPYTDESRTDENVIIYIYHSQYILKGEYENNEFIVHYYAKGKGLIGQNEYLACDNNKINPEEDYAAVCAGDYGYGDDGYGDYWALIAVD